MADNAALEPLWPNQPMIAAAALFVQILMHFGERNKLMKTVGTVNFAIKDVNN